MTIAYDLVGSGRTLVFLHGALSDRRVFGYQLMELSQSKRVIAADLPGYGQSDWNRTSPWMEAAVDDISDLVERVSGDHPVIVGWSLGGIVASKVATKVAGSRLILVGVRSIAAGEGESEMMRQRILSDFPRFARGMIRSFTSSMISQDTEEWLFNMAIGTPIDVHVASLANVAEPLHQPLPAGTISISGDWDQIVSPESSQLEGVKSVTLTSSGHMPFLEQARRFNQLITELTDDD